MAHEHRTATIVISDAVEDAPWDAFVASHPQGHHLQTSHWAQVKSAAGWSAVRVVAMCDGVVAGGAQILYRRLGRLGNLGYISVGPLVAAEDQSVIDELTRSIDLVARRRRIRAVVVQEPSPVLRRSPALRRAEPIGRVGQVVPRATCIVDVSQDLEDVLAGMKARTRYNTKVGARKGVVIREGAASDLPAYHTVLETTAARQGFTPYPLDYYQEMWRAFDPIGGIRLTLAECEGTPVAGQLVIAFGDTVVNKLSVWSGEEGSRRPNDAIQWDTIRWAHERGHRSYDLEGIRTEVAAAILEGKEPPAELMDSVTSFKLGYGGQVVMRPEPFVIIANPVLALAFRHLYPRFAGMKSARSMVERFRVSATSGPARPGRLAHHPP